RSWAAGDQRRQHVPAVPGCVLGAQCLEYRHAGGHLHADFFIGAGMPVEQPIPLQSDVVSSGPNIRTITVTLLVNGVPTPVVMQVMSVADADGRLFDQQTFGRPDMQVKILMELKSIRKLLSNPGSFEQGSDAPVEDI